MEQKENLLTFPCDFVIKLFGLKSSEEFESAVLTIIRKHCPDVRENALQYRPSKDDKYLAISANLHIENKEQLDALYQELTAHPLVLMAL